MDLGLKNALFDECLLSDGWLVGLGGIFVLLSMVISISCMMNNSSNQYICSGFTHHRCL